jgi:hypothetical protein
VAKSLGYRFNAKSDEKVQEMIKEITELGGLSFSIERYPNGDWMAKSTNIEGVLTGGGSKDDVDEWIKDAVYAYYDIEPQFCHEDLIALAGSPSIVQQEVFATA